MKLIAKEKNQCHVLVKNSHNQTAATVTESSITKTWLIEADFFLLTTALI